MSHRQLQEGRGLVCLVQHQSQAVTQEALNARPRDQQVTGMQHQQAEVLLIGAPPTCPGAKGRAQSWEPRERRVKGPPPLTARCCRITATGRSLSVLPQTGGRRVLPPCAEPGPGVHRLTGASPHGRAGWRRKEAKAPHAPRAEGTATGRHSGRSMGTRGQWALPPASGGQSIKRAPSPGGTVEGTASRQREGAEAGLESAHCSQAVRSGCGVTVSGHMVTRLENQGSEVTGRLHSEGKSLGVRRKGARQWPGKGRGLRRTAPWEQPVSERYTPARSSEQTRSPQPRSLPSV